LIENKGDIKLITDHIISSATKDEILENQNISLNGKDYNKKIIICNDNYEFVRLGDVCQFLPKSKRNASFGQTTGEYNFYTSSEKVQKCNTADFTEECIIVGSGGVANIKIDNMFSCSADNFVLKSEMNTYLYNYLKGNMELLSDGFTGSTLKHLSKDYLMKIKVAIPKNKKRLETWTEKFKKSHSEISSRRNRVQELEEIIADRIREIRQNEDCEIKQLGEILKILPNSKHNTSFGKLEGRYKFYNSSKEEKLFCDEYEIEEESLIVGFKGNINLHFDKCFTASQHMYVTQEICNSDVKCLKYIYYYLKNNEDLFSNYMHGSTIKHITKTNFNLIRINLPKNKMKIQELEPIFIEIETLQTGIKNAEALYKQALKELYDEALINEKASEVVVHTEEQVIEEPIQVVTRTSEPVIRKKNKSVSKK